MHESRTFGQKLKRHMEAELGRTNWRRGFAKEVASRTGQEPEHVRRMLYKWIDEGVEPTEASRRSITDTLGLDTGALDTDEEEESLVAALLAQALKAAVEADPQAREELRRLLGAA